MNVPDLQTMLDYHYWARDRLLDALEPLTSEQFNRDTGSSFKSIRETMVHIYAAEWAWYSRWQGNSPTALLPSNQFPDPASVRRAWSELEAKMREFLEGLGEDGIARARLQAAQRARRLVAVLADAAARREPRQLPSRSGDDDAQADRRAACEAYGHDRVLSNQGLGAGSWGTGSWG